jgi:osmotically-inducible protein OsmY
MVVEQTIHELNQDNNLAWKQSQGGFASNSASTENKTSQTMFGEKLYVGQNVFLTSDQPIGRIMKLLPGSEGRTSYFVIHTNHFWGRSKTLPVEWVNEINSKGVWLSIDQEKLQKLADYQTDIAITYEVENNLWEDAILRAAGYNEVAIRVENGIVFVTGHIPGIMNQGRVEEAIRKVEGVLGVKNFLIADDKLLLKVSEALVQVQRGAGNQVFAKVENGVVFLSGEVTSTEDRHAAEVCVASIPWVRAVINGLAAPGVNLETEDQRFIQPLIGEEIYFRDGFAGVVDQVIINPDNRRVVALVLQGRFPVRQEVSEDKIPEQNLSSERKIVIPVSVIRYLTNDSGFLLIDSSDTSQYQDFDTLRLTTPETDWVPPYPYPLRSVKLYVMPVRV